MEPSKEKTPPGGHGPPRDAALNRSAPRPCGPCANTGGVPIKPPNPRPRAAPLTHRAKPEFDQLLFPRFPVVPKAWPPQAKRRWRLGRRSRCPKFFARYRSQNFDRCHSFLLASSAAGGARNRPRFAKRSPGTRGDPLRLLPVIAKSEATWQSVTPVLSPVRPLSSTIHPSSIPPKKKVPPRHSRAGAGLRFSLGPSSGRTSFTGSQWTSS